MLRRLSAIASHLAIDSFKPIPAISAIGSQYIWREFKRFSNNPGEWGIPSE
jgi:hypothetical protein